MWSLLVITCIIFQTAVAVFLLNGVRRDEDIDKHLSAMLIILLVHLSTKVFLLAVLKDVFLYAAIPTGFGLAYGPLLLIIARGVLNTPLRPRAIFFQFFPFLVISLVYLVLVIAGVTGNIGRPAVAGYASWYEGLVIASLVGYPIYVKVLLRSGRMTEAREKTNLTGQMANVLLVGSSTAVVLCVLPFFAVHFPGFDLRLLPYICFSAIPVLILRYRLRERTERRSVIDPAMAIPFGDGEVAAAAAGEMVGREIGVDALLAAGSTGMGPVPVLVAAGCTGMGPVLGAAGSTGMCPVPVAAAAGSTVMDALVLGGRDQAVGVAAGERRYERSGMDARMMDDYEAALAVFMQKSRIYLDPDLSLEVLATRMKLSRHHLTQLLNEKFEKNFYSFINEYRIGEAIDRLNDPSLQVNILSLAFDCGFNSKSSFNNYFKKITGYTPTAYRKQRLERLIPAASSSV